MSEWTSELLDGCSGWKGTNCYIWECHNEHTAEEVAKELGAVTRGRITHERSRWDRGPDLRFSYYFNSDGHEVAYWCNIMATLCILNRPRVWSDEFKAKAVVRGL